MEGKDNRSMDKRKKMRQIKTKFHNHSQSSSTTPPVRGVADVASSSSDNRFVQVRERWSQSQQNRHYDLDELDLLDELENAEQAQLRAGDFTQMLQMPPSVGGHFKFSSEKDWDADDNGSDLLKNTEASEYFTLNLKLINTGLRTIPFHKRMEYPSSLFTNDELLTIEKEAEEAEKEYQQLLQGLNNNPNINVSSAKPDKTPTENPGTTNADVIQLTNQTEKLNIEENANDNVKATTDATTNNNTDIQEWLDNVLDEEN